MKILSYRPGLERIGNRQLLIQKQRKKTTFQDTTMAAYDQPVVTQSCLKNHRKLSV